MSTKQKRDPEPYLPLTPAMFHVLLALADRDKHGYAVIKEVRLRTQGKVRLSAGTLYGIIKRLLAGRLIEESEDRPDPFLDDERRRYYRLTDFGRRVAAAEARRMQELIKQAREKMLLERYETA